MVNITTYPRDHGFNVGDQIELIGVRKPLIIRTLLKLAFLRKTKYTITSIATTSFEYE